MIWLHRPTTLWWIRLAINSMQPYQRAHLDPLHRPLRIYTLDPTASRLDGAVATLNLPFERLSSGPVSSILEVVDWAETTGQFNKPVDLDDPRILIESGRVPSPSDPMFRQQMVYTLWIIIARYRRREHYGPGFWNRGGSQRCVLLGGGTPGDWRRSIGIVVEGIIEAWRRVIGEDGRAAGEEGARGGMGWVGGIDRGGRRCWPRGPREGSPRLCSCPGIIVLRTGGQRDPPGVSIFLIRHPHVGPLARLALDFERPPF